MGSRFFFALGVGGGEEGAEGGAEEEGGRLSNQGGGTKGAAGGMLVMVRARAAFSSADSFLGSKRTFITSW